MVVKTEKIRVAYGDIDMELTATMMGTGSISLMLRKDLNQPGAFCFGSAIDYGGIGWTIVFQDEYFMFEPKRVRSKDYKGDCLMLDDKQAILDRLKELNFI